ncbi:MAG TPA: ParB/RepB/Spo0J family partition protein [Gammaproteobacteria bacterium]
MQDVLEVGVDELRPGRYQPRLQLREESLAELAESIREQGVLQPLIVRALGAGGEAARTYEIVAGERRWRAARLAGLAAVPVLVRELTDQEALAVALIENLQREDLNPIDQAQSMSRLVASSLPTTSRQR